ncbi:MAG: non-ribosomal peptide synthetase [Lachnospiraceae bacterium]|nr:non-ribosomal peptide synthetase [Lachnospiraceae bacterium]
MLVTETHNIYDLVYRASSIYGDKDYLRYLSNGEIKSITFNKFKEATDAIAVWTIKQNRKLGKSVKIAMLSPNNALYAELMIGVMCGGGISVPMDPQITHEALCNCINRAEVDIIIYDKTIKLDRKDIFNRCKTVKSIFHIEDTENRDCLDIIEQYKGLEVKPEINEKDCAVIIFTSGTTGVEKGVMLSHANLIDTTFNGDFEAQIQLCVLPMHHAFGLKADFLTALGIGSITCFHNGMDKLGEALHAFQPTNLNMVPMIANALYTKIVLLSQQTRKTLEECKELVFGKNIKQIITGGAHLPAELVDKYHAIGVFIAQGYGMSECSPTISIPVMDRYDKAHTGGKVVRGCETRIVDGEIQVKSPSVMIGYINAPELTKEILTEDGWLKTGDLGHVDDEGFIYITGRKKNLIILSNGENVAPEQIENFLLDHQLVEECLVYGDGNQVVAEIYTNDKYAKLNHITDIIGEVDHIIKDVNSKLVSYQKIMKHIVRKNPFLKTSTNKIIRNQRATIDDTLVVESDRINLPISDMQKKLHEIISGVLGHKEFGINTDLFDVGLDSLGCIMLLTELNDIISLNLELDELMSNATVEKLETLYIKKNTSKNVDYSIRPVYPLTNVQKFMAYVMRGNTTSNIPFLYKLDDSVDLENLKYAIENLFNIHPILKATIEMHEDKGLALFRHDELEVNIPIYSMQEEEWLETKDELVKPYKYGKGEPLYHIGIYNVEGDKYLFIDIAHVISDGMSIGIILRNINKLYLGEKVKKETYTFYEYCLDDKFRAENGLRADNELYFQRLMSGMKLDRTILNRTNNGDLTVERNAVIHDSFKNLNFRRINEFCHKNGVSKNILFLTAFNYCISIFSDKDDVISTSIHNGRTDSRWGTLVGALFTTYNFRYKLDKHQTINEMLEASAKQVMETMCCHVNNLHADEMFIQYQGDLFSDLDIGGKPAEYIPLQLDSLPFHLMIHATKTGFTYELRYWENRFKEKQLRIFMEVLESIVHGIIRIDNINNLRSYIPKKYLVKDTEVNGQAITILNRYGDIQPIGGWGELIINNEKTGKIARLTVNNEIDYLENSGRTVMQETLTGRNFINLAKLEQDVKELVAADCKNEAYIVYGENNKFTLVVDIKSKEAIVDVEEIKEVIARYCEKSNQPYKLLINGLEE